MNDFVSSVLTAVIFIGGVGLICALLLVIASKVMAVKEDERVAKVRQCLPGANCGACGFTGCDGYADALVHKPGTKTNLCVPGGGSVSKKISEALGVKFEEVEKKVAEVCCNGGCQSTQKKQNYTGIKTCAAAKMFYGGDGLCSYGCLGYGDCQKVCPTGAICIQDGIARINQSQCIGCGLCAKTCPKGIISVISHNAAVAVKCSSLDAGAAARKNCLSACIGCKKCEKSCPSGAVTVSENLAHIDYLLCTGCAVCSEVCPTHAIKRLMPVGEQAI